MQRSAQLLTTVLESTLVKSVSSLNILNHTKKVCFVDKTFKLQRALELLYVMQFIKNTKMLIATNTLFTRNQPKCLYRKTDYRKTKKG